MNERHTMLSTSRFPAVTVMRRHARLELQYLEANRTDWAAPFLLHKAVWRSWIEIYKELQIRNFWDVRRVSRKAGNAHQVLQAGVLERRAGVELKASYRAVAHLCSILFAVITCVLVACPCSLSSCCCCKVSWWLEGVQSSVSEVAVCC
jgi:hypothetical protein